MRSGSHPEAPSAEEAWDRRLTTIGGYFGLAISDANVYGFFVSTHYPSKVRADEAGPVYYQQQAQATVARSDLGL